MANEKDVISIYARLVDQFTPAAKRIKSELSGLGSLASKISKPFLALPVALAAIAVPLLGIAGAIKAIGAAASAAEGENKLRTALQGNNALLQARLKAADALSAKSRNDNDAFIAAEVTLRNLGVSSAKIDKALEASRQLAAATGMSLAEAATQLGRTVDGSIGRLGEAIPALQGVSAEALRSGAAFDIVAAKFAGFDEALAGDVFGRATQAQNKLGDQFERIGSVLAIVRTRLIEGVLPGVKQFVDYLDTPGGRNFVNSVADGMAYLLKLIPRVSEWFASTSSRLDDLEASFFDTLATIGIYIRTFLYDVPRGIVLSLIEFVDAKFDYLASSVRAKFQKALSYIPKSGVSEQDAKDAQDEANKASARASNSLLGTISNLTTSALTNFEAELEQLKDENLKRSQAAVRDANNDIDQQRRDDSEFEKAQAKSVADAITADNVTAQKRLFQTLAELRTKHLTAGRREEVAELDKALADKRVSLEQYAADRDRIEIQPIRESIREIQLELVKLTTTSLAKVLQGKDAVQDLERLRTLSARLAELSQTRKTLEDAILAIVRDQTSAAEKNATLSRQRADDIELELRARNSLANGNREEADALQEQLKFKRELRELQASDVADKGRLLTLTQQVQDAESRARVARQANGEVDEQARKLIDDLTQAERERQRSIQETTNLSKSGALSQKTATEQIGRAQDAYRVKVAFTIDELKRLRDLATDPALQHRIDGYVADAAGKLNQEQQRTADTFGGMIDEYFTFAENVNARASQLFLQSPLSGFFSDFISGSKSAGEAFRDFIGNIAKSLGDLAAQMLANNILVNLFGGSIGGNPVNGLLGGLFNRAPGRNAGGFIGDPVGPDRDTIPAWLTAGEFVVSRRAAQAHAGLIEFVNRVGSSMSTPALLDRFLAMGNISSTRPMPAMISGPVRLNAGGSVPVGGGRARADTVMVAAYVAPTERAANAILSAGNGDPLVMAIQRKATAVRIALGFTS